MAFTSKAVFLVLLSILAWCQVCSAGPSLTSEIVQGFDQISGMADNLLPIINGDTPLGVASSEIPRRLDKMTTTITSLGYRVQNWLAKADGKSKTKIGKRVVQAETKYGNSMVAVFKALDEMHSNQKLFPSFEGIRKSLANLNTAMDGTMGLIKSIDSSEKPIGVLLQAGTLGLQLVSNYTP